MQSIIYQALVKSLVALWPQLEPVVVAAVVAVIRKGVQALKDQTLAADSPFKPLELLGDEVLNQILAALPAPPAGLPSV